MKVVSIGKIIEEKLRESGMTVSELARQIHCDRVTVYNILNNQSIDINRLIAISKVLNYDFIQNEYIKPDEKDQKIKITMEISKHDLKQIMLLEKLLKNANVLKFITTDV